MAQPVDVLIVGSLNADYHLRVDEFPGAGQTVFGHEWSVRPGGKGLNQAISVVRAGGRVSLVGTIGVDADADVLLEALRVHGVPADFVRRLASTPTGQAVVFVDQHGENRIVVLPNANRQTATHQVVVALASVEPTTVLLQTEIPAATVVDVLGRPGLAPRAVLNLAPYLALPADVLSELDTLIVNQTEAAALLDVDALEPRQALAAARRLAQLGPRRVIVTLGRAGAVGVDRAHPDGLHRPGREVPVVDTTGAGDAFVGAASLAIARGRDLDDVLAAGAAAGELAVQRRGAS